MADKTNRYELARLKRAALVPRIREMTARGLYPHAIGPELGVTLPTIKRAAAEAGVTLNRSQRVRANLPDPVPPPDLTAEQRYVYCRRAFAEGHTYAALGRVLGLCKQRIHQICSRRPRSRR